MVEWPWKGRERNKRLSILHIFTVKLEDWTQMPNSAKSLFQRTQHKNVLSTLAQSRESNMAIGL